MTSDPQPSSGGKTKKGEKKQCRKSKTTSSVNYGGANSGHGDGAWDGGNRCIIF